MSAAVAMGVAMCAAAVPELSVPQCAKGTAHVGHYWVTTEPGLVKPKQQTSASVCWDAKGWQVHMVAEDKHTFSPYKQCNAKVWVSSDVMEVFFAPVQSSDDAPTWYYEMDTAPTGALFGTVIENSQGNTSYCSLARCTAGNLACSGLATFPMGIHSVAHVSAQGWAVNLTVPWSAFAADYQPKAGKPHPFWRANFYRYDYPEGPNKDFSNFELSGWSPTHNPSFHVPPQFGKLAPQ